MARLEAENEAFRKTQPEWQRKVEEANRVLEEQRSRGGFTPPPAPAGDPLDEDSDGLRNLLAVYPNDPQAPAWRSTLRINEAARAERDWRKTVAAEGPRIAASAEPDSVKQRAWELLSSRQVQNAAAGLAIARGESAGDITARESALKKEREEIDKDKKAREQGRVGLGSRPIFGAEKPAGDKVKEVKLSDWQKIDAMPDDDPNKKAWLREYNAGRVNILNE